MSSFTSGCAHSKQRAAEGGPQGCEPGTLLSVKCTPPLSANHSRAKIPTEKSVLIMIKSNFCRSGVRLNHVVKTLAERSDRWNIYGEPCSHLFILCFCNWVIDLILVCIETLWKQKGEEKKRVREDNFPEFDLFIRRLFTKCTYIRVSCQVGRVIAAAVCARRTMPLIMLPSPPCQKRQNGSKAIRKWVSKQLTSFVCSCCQSRAL